MLRAHLIELDHLVLQAKLGIAQRAHEFTEVANVNLEAAGQSRERTAALRVRVNEGSLKFDWKSMTRTGHTKLESFSTHPAREREQVGRIAPGVMPSLISEIIERKQAIAEAWTRICQIGKKMNGAIALGKLDSWEASGDFRQQCLEEPPSGLDAHHGGELHPFLDELLARFDLIRTELALEGSALSAYWRWETEKKIRGMGGWDPSNSCPVYLRATATGRFRLEWFSASTVKKGGIHQDKAKTYHRPYRFTKSSPTSKTKNVLAPPHHKLWINVDRRRREVLKAWENLSELAALTRALKESNAAADIEWQEIPAERSAKWVFKSHLPASLTKILHLEAIARSPAGVMHG